MKYTIRGKNIEVTAGIKEHVEAKLSKLDKYFDDADNITANVLVRVYDSLQKIEVTIPTKKFLLRIDERHPDLYVAIDHAADKLERQIRKNKTKLETKYKDSQTDFKLSNIDTDDSVDQSEDKVVKNKKLEVKPMDLEEAVLQMELLNHDFFVYHDEEVDGICVLYKRKDGDYGLIETA